MLGRRIYGSYPSMAVNPESGAEVNPLDTGRGRLIPTTSCDQFFAEMALGQNDIVSREIYLPVQQNVQIVRGGALAVDYISSIKALLFDVRKQPGKAAVIAAAQDAVVEYRLQYRRLVSGCGLRVSELDFLSLVTAQDCGSRVDRGTN